VKSFGSFLKIQAIILSIILTMVISVATANEVVQISSNFCAPGSHKQPNGLFALFVFCDDVLGTNVAVYLHKIGTPIVGKYSRGRRFWQGEKWSWSATSYSWINKNRLLIGTSLNFGSGSVFLLNLEAQTYEEVLPLEDGACTSRLLAVDGNKVKVEFTGCETDDKSIVEFRIPNQNSGDT